MLHRINDRIFTLIRNFVKCIQLDWPSEAATGTGKVHRNKCLVSIVYQFLFSLLLCILFSIFCCFLVAFSAFGVWHLFGFHSSAADAFVSSLLSVIFKYNNCKMKLKTHEWHGMARKTLFGPRLGLGLVAAANVSNIFIMLFFFYFIVSASFISARFVDSSLYFSGGRTWRMPAQR